MNEESTNRGRSALVTGAARGIGLATARLFPERGWQVAMIDRDAEGLAGAGLAGARAILCDVSVPEQVDAMIAALGGAPLHALINNAGVAEFGPIEECGFEMWRRGMETSLDGVFLVGRAATPLLKAARGAIVNIASISGLRASTLRVACGTAKAGVQQFTRQQAVELGEYGIRANCVAPGPVRTKPAMAARGLWVCALRHRARDRRGDRLPLFGCGQPCHRPDHRRGWRLRGHRRRPAGAARLKAERTERTERKRRGGGGGGRRPAGRLRSAPG